MKVSQIKRSRWLSVGLVIMLFALLSFSMLPLISSIVQESRSFVPPSAANSGIPQDQKAKLDAEALGYQLVLEREPDNQNALRGLLETKLRQNDIKGAIEPLTKLTQLNPQQTDYTLLLAQAKQQLSDYGGAEVIYRTLLVSHPEDIRALKGIVDLLLAQTRQEEAISLVQTNLKKAVKANLEPARTSASLDITSVQLLLGEIYVQQKRYPEAIAIYDQARETNKEDFRPILAKAMVLQEQGKNTEAEPLFKTAVSLAPIQYQEQIKLRALGSKP